MRRVHIRGAANVEKRYIIHLAGFNLGMLLRTLFGLGTPRRWADAPVMLLFAQIGAIRLHILAIWPPGSAGRGNLPVIICINWAG